MNTLTPRAAGALAAEQMFKVAAPLGTMGRFGGAVGTAMDTFGGAVARGFGVAGKAFGSGSRAAGAAGAGTAGKFFSGLGNSITRGAQAFNRAGGTKPMLQGLGTAAGAYAGYKGLQHAFGPSQPHYQQGF